MLKVESPALKRAFQKLLCPVHCLLEATTAAAVAPSATQPPQGLSRRRAALADQQPNPSEAGAATSLASALARERIRRRGEAQETLPFWQRTWFLALLLAMAAASFALALLLYLGLDLPEAAPAQSYAADPDTVVEVGDLWPPSHLFIYVLLFVFARCLYLVSVARFGLGLGNAGLDA